MMTHDDRGEGGVKNCQNGGDVICGWPLMEVELIIWPPPGIMKISKHEYCLHIGTIIWNKYLVGNWIFFNQRNTYIFLLMVLYDLFNND